MLRVNISKLLKYMHNIRCVKLLAVNIYAAFKLEEYKLITIFISRD